MTGLKGTITYENLKDAFAVESHTNRRYLWFAQKADIEGLPEVASTGLPIGDSEQNLKASIAGETYKHTHMYPDFAKTAREEGFSEIADWFEILARAEKSNANQFSHGLKSIS